MIKSMEKLLLQDEQVFAATASFNKIKNYAQEYQLSSDSESVMLYRMCRYLQKNDRTLAGNIRKPEAQTQCREIRQTLRDYASKYNFNQSALNDLKAKTIGTKNAATAESLFRIIEEINGQKPQ